MPDSAAKLRQHKVTSDELGDYIDRVVRNFVKHRSEVNASRSGSSGPRRTTCDERRDNQADRTATLRELAATPELPNSTATATDVCCAGPAKPSATSAAPGGA